MSVMTRNPDGSWNQPGSPTGRPLGPITQAPVQRQAVIDQLAPPTAGAPGALPRPTGAPSTGGASPFARGGKVKQLPGAGTAGQIGNLGVSIGSQVAGNLAKQAGTNIAKQGVESVAKQVGGRAASLGASAANMGAGMGISLGTDLLASKLRDKEDTPEFGGEFGEYTDELGRRFQGTGGGMASNAVKYAGYGANPALAASTMGLSVLGGAAAGAIKGAITKHAKSAFTDFKVEDAADAIKAQYQKELGREASDDEVMGLLQGQGWDPKGGDRWVGEKGLFGVMGAIRNSPEAAAYAQRGAVVDQLGAGGGEPTAAPDLSGRAGGSAPAPPGSGGVPGSEPAPPLGAEGDAGGAAPPDSSGWDTDQYAAPQYVPPQAGAVPAGWDAEKWNDPTHQTPKYGVGRILSNFPPTVEGLGQAMGDIEKAYPGTTFNGKDKLQIPGVGTIDVLEAAGEGGKAWRWDDGSGEAAADGGATPASGATLPGEPGEGGDLLAQLQAEIDRITKGAGPQRGAVMEQLGAEA